MRYKTSNIESRKAKEECSGRYKMLFIKHNIRVKCILEITLFAEKCYLQITIRVRYNP